MRRIQANERAADGRYALTTTRRSTAAKRPLRPWPAWHQEALRLLLAEQLTQRTIAARVGVSYSAVRKCFARPAIRRAVRQYGQQYDAMLRALVAEGEAELREFVAEVDRL